MIKHFFVAAFRNIKRNITTTIVSLFGLSISFTSFILILLWVQNELSFDNYHDKANNIYLTEVKYTGFEGLNPLTIYPVGNILQNNPYVDLVTRLNTARKVEVINGNAFKDYNIAIVDSNWFKIFNYKVLEGSVKNWDTDPYSLVLTASEAKKLFGNNHSLGRFVMMDSVPFQVKAVVQDNPSNSSFQFKALIASTSQKNKRNQNPYENDWNNSNFRTFVRLFPNTNVTKFQNAISCTIQNGFNKIDADVVLQPLNELHFDIDSFDPAFKRGSHLAVWIFGILSIVLLIMGSINYVNFTVAKINVRTKEVSIRKIIGSSKNQIFWQFLIESFLMCVFALILSLLLISISLPIFDTITEINFQFSQHYFLFGLLSLITLLLVTFLNGVLPALTITYFKPLDFLQGHTLLKWKNVFFRKCLVVFQFVVSIVFIIGTIVIFKQMKLAQNTTTQYNRSQVVTFSLPYSVVRKMNYNSKQIIDFCQYFKNQLLKDNSIDKVALLNTAPEGSMNSSGVQGYYWQGKDTSLKFPITRLYVSSEAKDIFNFQIVAGRWFQDGDRDKGNFVLNETAVKQMAIVNPIGSLFAKSQGDTGHIIGVIKDYAFKSLHDKIGAMAICNSDDDGRTDFYVKIFPGKVSQAMDRINSIFKKSIPGEPLDYLFMNQSFQMLYKNDIKISNLMLLFSCAVILIAFMGLFGMIVFIAEQRVKEIGIRKVFGASALRIISLLSYAFLSLIIVSMFIAFPIAWWLSSKWLDFFAYKIDLNWEIFAFVGLILIFVSSIIMSFQVYRSATANPVNSLRSE
ncbi:ABC transporter permease [Rhizosphaericola mali]|uniref:FtsX-like permease family protein n=1 Tax=Rhizosphaericola mali TaxID=2545455 RepID=A0A5P2G0X6_9BACT|nr:ABC transporter permease [Rhizosphaericola mali]QES89085.1 FtsX-like permease family protein [Rhizosphaericola mali]